MSDGSPVDRGMTRTMATLSNARARGVAKRVEALQYPPTNGRKAKKRWRTGEQGNGRVNADALYAIVLDVEVRMHIVILTPNLACLR